MKKLRPHPQNKSKKVACTVSAAALMLGVSQAATVGMHFQESYCPGPGYSGYIVTLTAFGIAPSGWENLMPMQSGYNSGGICTNANMAIYTLSQMVSSTTSGGGLNPLPNGTVNVTWTANAANFSGFAGYGITLPGYGYFSLNSSNLNSYGYEGQPPDGRGQPYPTGEWQIYNTFLRDGKNYGPFDNTGAFGNCDNSMPPYVVDITGLKSLFTNTPFVVELIASADSMLTLTNAFVIDVNHSVTNSVTYPSTPLPHDEGTCAWNRGHGGGLSTASGTLNADHIQITSNHPDHGGTGGPPTGFDRAGTISGFILTDKPVVTMSPQSVMAMPGDSLVLSAYAIGVSPLSYQWRKNGNPISGATSNVLTFASLKGTDGASYDLVVTNLYGKATSTVATIMDSIALTTGSKFVVDSNPANPERDGVNSGASWLASSSDGSITRTGVMQFAAIHTNGIDVQGTTNFDSTAASYTFWMRSAGTDMSAPGSVGASLVTRPGSSTINDLNILQLDNGNLYFSAPGNAVFFSSAANVSSNRWHLIALTCDGSASGSASLYVDGVLDTTFPNSSAWTNPIGQPVQIGYTSDPTYRAYNGMLSDVRIYNRQLTSVEVASLFATGALIDTSALQMRFAFATPPLPGVILTWQAPNTILQSATSVSGAYSDLNAVVSPYYVVPVASHKFYRYRGPSRAPQAFVSNPYLM